MNTLFLLLARFESPTVKLEDICNEYFGLGRDTAYERAALATLPVPTFRTADSQKAPRMVHLQDLAKLIDEQHERAAAEWQKAKVA